MSGLFIMTKRNCLFDYRDPWQLEKTLEHFGELHVKKV